MPKDIEKESLEAHVEICNMRHDNLKATFEHNIEDVKEEIEEVKASVVQLSLTVQQIRDALFNHINGSNVQIIRWGIGVVGSLISALAALTFMYIKKGS